MISAYILTMIFAAGPSGLTSIVVEYDTKAACETAMNTNRESSVARVILATCTKKS